MNSHVKKAVISEHKTWSRFVTAIWVTLLACSVVLNLLLSQRVKQVTGLLTDIQSERKLQVGADVPTLEAKDLTGKSFSVLYSETDQQTILYVFTPQCCWCERNLQNIKKLASETHSKYKLIGLSLSNDGLRDYLEKNNLNFTVYTEPPFSVTSAYKLGGTPQTIVISPEGKIIKNWIGAYTEDVAVEVEDFFKIHLPGVEDKQ